MRTRLLSTALPLCPHHLALPGLADHPSIYPNASSYPMLKLAFFRKFIFIAITRSVPWQDVHQERMYGGSRDMLCLQMTTHPSGNTFLCNLACNANGGHLASKVLQQLSPEKQCHSHLFLEDRKLDLQQTVNENGLVDGSEVHYLINQALSNKRPKELHVPSRAEVVSSVVANLMRILF